MSMNKDAWGIEVGSQAIKAIKLSRTATGIAMEDFDVLPFKQVLTTPDLNVEEAIRVNLESLAQKHEFDKSTVAVSVPGNMAFARFAKLPPIEASKVKSIVAYEAQQQIPFPMDEVEWDYEVFEQEDAPDIEVGIFAITKERVAHVLSNYRAVDVRVDTLTLSPVAVYNAFAYENEFGTGHGDNTVYLDIGTNSTDIIVVESGSIWLRTLQLGGNHFTNALMKQLKISHAKAEKLKLEARTSKYAKHIMVATRGVMNELVTEIQRSLGFYTSLNRDAELTKIVGVGSTWKLPGLQKYLKQNLQMDVVRPDGFSQLHVEDRRAAEFSSVAFNMATVYGLALQGLGLATVEANILPQSILQQRMWKAKQPWIGAAAACVAAAPLLGLGMMMLTDSSYKSELAVAKPGIDQTLREANQFKQEYNTVQTNDPRPGITNYRRAFDYVNLIPGIVEDVSRAMATIKPNADLKNIDWNNPSDIERFAERPREQRGMAWITDVDTIYIPPVPGDSTDEASGGPIPNEFGGPIASAAPSAPGVASLLPQIEFPEKSDAPEQASPDGSLESDEGTDKAALYDDEVSPRITVTVRGIATMKSQNISSLLQDKFEGWLKANSVRSDRPYLIVPSITDFRGTRRTLTGTTDKSRDNTGFLGEADNLRRTPAPKTLEPAVQPAPGVLPGPDGLGLPGPEGRPGLGTQATQALEIQTPEGWYATLGQSGLSFSPGALLPRRPLSAEDLSQDTVFSFTFDVILLSPNDARPTILNVPDDDRTEPDEPPATQAQKRDMNNNNAKGQA